MNSGHLGPASHDRGRRLVTDGTGTEHRYHDTQTVPV